MVMGYFNTTATLSLFTQFGGDSKACFTTFRHSIFSETSKGGDKEEVGRGKKTGTTDKHLLLLGVDQIPIF